MTRPHGITGSLTPTFVPARAVALAVRRPSAFALVVRLPTALRAPSRASVTISEATAPVKLPASHGPRRGKRRREIVNKTRVVFHWLLPQSLNPGIDPDHLCYARHADDPRPPHLRPAPLLPKLRGNFAEFLLRKSLEHLRLLASPTCVGLRYGHSTA